VLGGALLRRSYEPGRVPISIDELISPLRFDILLRQEYLVFLREHRELAERDFASFLELSRGHAYYDWYTKVEYPATRPHWDGDRATVEASFVERVAKTIAVFDDLEAGGYDRRRPVILRTGEEVAATATGKLVAAPAYAGDGCHRLAWLRLGGLSELSPEMYRVQRTARFEPRDMTALVLHALGVDPPRYFEFLSLGYADRRLRSERELLDQVASASPDRLDEVRRIIAVDRPLLAPRSSG
jgi:hypothetical protein